ncbi:MAG TPA: MOSC domain-containing protein [Kiloniellales bacterium]|nr:MOSC domain-containing protein [Kiloniellales bacterium]
MAASIADLCRYPVKGLNAECLERVTLSAGEGLPGDRRFALAHGSTAFDPETPQWLPKTHFLMLMRDEKLAQLRASFDSESGVLTVRRAGKPVARGRITEPTGRTLIGQFFAGFMGRAARGTPHLVEAPGHMFSDAREKYVSMINLESVADLERVMRRPVAPARFRANLYFRGAPAWSEFDWIGREIRLGDARLKIDARIDRCAATNVNPETAERDMNVPLTLQRGFGHADMGVYARVVEGGDIALGDAITMA